MSYVESVRSVKKSQKISPEVFNIDNNEGPYKPVNTLDPNVYATKKTIAQGLLDVALLTANASQLKYCLQLGKKHQFYYLMLSLISSSIVLQIALGVTILLKARFNINNSDHQRSANFYNNLVVGIVFVITTINIIISSFGIDPDLSNRLANQTIFNNSVIVGGLFVIIGYRNFNDESKQRILNIMNNSASVFVFFITVINVLIAGFGFNFDDTLK